ncbi:MAG: hypothetical protein H5T84_09460, partial [Thermoleophilia bacterium]|nr:hypothetical protein [Thermoleophilia bacterium]
MRAELKQVLGQAAGTPGVLAIDDCHLLEGTSEAAAVLETLAYSLPPGWVLLLASRHPLPCELDLARLGGRYVSLDARDLRLTPGEVMTWAQQNWGVNLDRNEARALWRLTEGWPVALVLLGQRLHYVEAAIRKNDVLRVIGKGGSLRTYLESHILTHLDETSRALLLRAALLPRVVFPRDESFLPGGPGEAETMLGEFVRRGFLVTKVGPRIFVLHPLLRGLALRQELPAGTTADDLVEQAATHLVRHGEYYSAASLSLKTGRLSSASAALRPLVLGSLNATANFAPESWLSLIPESAAKENPWLLATRGRILQHQRRYAQAAAAYDRTAALLRSRGEKEGLLPVLLSLAFCLYLRGQLSESLCVLERCWTLAASPAERVEVLIPRGNVLASLSRWDEA